MHKCPQKDIQKKSITDYKETFKRGNCSKMGDKDEIREGFL